MLKALCLSLVEIAPWERVILCFTKLILLVVFYTLLARDVRGDIYNVVVEEESPPVGTPLSNSRIAHVTSFAGFEPPIISRSGRIALKAELIGGGVTTLNNAAIFSSERDNNGSERLRLVAQEGDPASELWPGVLLSGLHDLQSSYDGKIGFRSVLSGPGVTSSNANSYWVFDGVGLQLAARSGTNFTAAALGNISEFAVQGIPQIPIEGGVAPLAGFKATRSGYPSEFSLLNMSSSSLHVLASVNTPLPGVPDINFWTALRRVPGGAGRDLISSSLIGNGVTSANNKILYLTEGNVLHYISRLGGAVPGIPGATFAAFDPPRTSPRVNRKGVAAFTANLSGSVNGESVWRVRRAAGQQVMELLVKAGEIASAANLPTGVQFDTFSATPNTNAGNLEIGHDVDNAVALLARLRGPGIDATNDRSLWLLQSAVSKTLIAQGGQEVAPGVTLVNQSIATDVKINHRGEVVFLAQVVNGTGEIGDAIFKFSQGRLRLLVMQNQLLPDSIDRWIRQLRWMPGLQFNELGQIVFVGTLGFTASDATGTSALFRIDQNENVRAVAHTGRDFNLDDGRLVSPSSWAINANASLSDTGEIVFATNFINSTVAKPAVVRVLIEPERASPGQTADINNDGVVTLQDLFAFLEQWFTNSSVGDFNQDGVHTVQDLFDFLDLYFQSL